MNKFQGKQVFVDYIGCDFNNKSGDWMLKLMQYAVKKANVREVHAHVEEFDGTQSPTGFAAVILLDESHVSAHCYYGKGLLAIDAFTCGKGNPNQIIDIIQEGLVNEMSGIKEISRSEIQRFRH